MNENNCLNKYDSYNLIHVNWNNYNTNMISKSSPCIKYDIILLFFRLFAFIYMLSTSIMFFLIDNSFTENQEINFIYLTYWSWFIDLLYYGITSFYSFYDLYNKDSNNKRPPQQVKKYRINIQNIPSKSIFAIFTEKKKFRHKKHNVRGCFKFANQSLKLFSKSTTCAKDASRKWTDRNILLLCIV